MDDFEDGNIEGWTVVDQGNAELSSSQTHSGNYSMKMWNPNPGSNWYTKVKRDLFLASEGVYEAWFYVSLFNDDGNLYFQFLDSNNFYWVNCCPIGTDWPGLVLRKRLGGVQTLLARVPPPFDRDEWFKVTVHKYSNGTIEVYINYSLQIALNDTDIMQKGGFCVGSFEEAWVDDVCYRPLDDQIPTLTEWGMIIFAVLLLGFMAHTVIRRRKRVGVGV